MSLKEFIKFPPTKGTVKQNFDWEFLNRIIGKFEESENNKATKAMKMNGLKNHFDIGGARDLTKHILAKNS